MTATQTKKTVRELPKLRSRSADKALERCGRFERCGRYERCGRFDRCGR